MGLTRSNIGVSSSQSERIRSRLRAELRNVKMKITVGARAAAPAAPRESVKAKGSDA